jgi:hypothetical protein
MSCTKGISRKPLILPYLSIITGKLVLAGPLNVPFKVLKGKLRIKFVFADLEVAMFNFISLASGTPSGNFTVLTTMIESRELPSVFVMVHFI